MTPDIEKYLEELKHSLRYEFGITMEDEYIITNLDKDFRGLVNQAISYAMQKLLVEWKEELTSAHGRQDIVDRRSLERMKKRAEELSSKYIIKEKR